MKSIIDCLREWIPVKFWFSVKGEAFYKEKWNEIWERIDNHNLSVENRETEENSKKLENQTINFLKNKKVI